MKITKKALAFTLSAAMGISAIPAMNCSAAERTVFERENYSATYENSFSLEFVVIMWSENDNGELTITGCSPHAFRKDKGLSYVKCSRKLCVQRNAQTSVTHKRKACYCNQWL